MPEAGAIRPNRTSLEDFRNCLIPYGRAKAGRHSGSYRTFRHRSVHSASSAPKETQPQAHANRPDIRAWERDIQGKQERGFDHEFVEPIDEETVLSFLDAGATA